MYLYTYIAVSNTNDELPYADARKRISHFTIHEQCANIKNSVFAMQENIHSDRKPQLRHQNAKLPDNRVHRTRRERILISSPE